MIDWRRGIKGQDRVEAIWRRLVLLERTSILFLQVAPIFLSWLLLLAFPSVFDRMGPNTMYEGPSKQRKNFLSVNPEQIRLEKKLRCRRPPLHVHGMVVVQQPCLIPNLLGFPKKCHNRNHWSISDSPLNPSGFMPYKFWKAANPNRAPIVIHWI